MNWVPILMRRSFLQYLVGVFQAIQKPLGCFLPRYGSNLGNARIPLRRHVYIKSHFEIYINKMGSNKKVTPGTPLTHFPKRGRGAPGVTSLYLSHKMKHVTLTNGILAIGAQPNESSQRLID